MGHEMNHGGEKGKERMMQGKYLAELLEREGPFSPARVFSWMEPVVRQLAREHEEGCVHGGITPACIIIYHQLWYCFPLPDERRKGFSTWEKGREKGRLTVGQRQNAQGSDADRSQDWDALEAQMNRGAAGPWSDVYSLCAVMYYAITGRPPENAANRMSGAELRPPSQLGIQINAMQEAALMKGLALLRKDRWQNAGELYQALYGNGNLKENFHFREQDGAEEKEKENRKEQRQDSPDPEREWREREGCERKRSGSGEKKRAVIASTAGVAAVLLLIFLITGTGARNTDSILISSTAPEARTAEEAKEETDSQDTAQTENEEIPGYVRPRMLMADPGESVDKVQLLGTGIACEAVVSVTFSDTLSDRPADCWDVSAGGDGSVWAWAKENGEGYDLYIGAEGGVTANPNSSRLFANCVSLSQMSGLEHFDTSQATDMGWMFYGCISLTALDVSSFDTSQATDMEGMFYGCSGLTVLNAGGLDTSQVTDMGRMFYDCGSLAELNISGFNTSRTTDMGAMFYNCRSLTALDVSGFNTSQVTDMGHMFSGCGNLTELDVSGFDTSQAEDMGSMFYECGSLTALDVSGFDTSRTANMGLMFSTCRSLTELDVSSFNTSQATDMGWMFGNCSGLTELDVSGFNTSQVTDMQGMFSDCSGLTALDVSSFDTSQVTNMRYMFSYCSGLTELDVSGFDTSQVTDMSGMFASCENLAQLDISGFDMAGVEDDALMLFNTPLD